MTRKMSYDKEADAAYIYLAEVKAKSVKKTVPLSESIMVDLDKNGKILGIEILGASKMLKKESLAKAMASA